MGCLAFVFLLHAVSGLPFWPRLRKLLGGYDPDYPKPALEEDEVVLKEERAIFTKGFFGAGAVGPLILTNDRMIWYDDSAYVTWPLKRISHNFALREIASVHKGWSLEHIFGGQRLYLRLRNGKSKGLWVDDIDHWVRTIRTAIPAAQ